MNLTELYDTVESISLSKNNVHSFHMSDPYQALNLKEVRYGAVCFYVEDVYDIENTRTYDAILYYADRLTEGGDNWVSVQDDGINILSSIVNSIRDIQDVVDVDFEITYTTFKQKFADYNAGAYCSIKIKTPLDNCFEVE